MTDNLSNPSPQFGTAEYSSKPGASVCKSCNQTISSAYYRVNGSTACANCAQQLKNQLPKDSHSAFVRGLIFGVGGAILGLIIYSAFGIITGWMIGYISLAVGYIVGKAIMKGSGGLGGRRYQVAAVLLTYAAVSMAAIPIGISQFIKQKEAQEHAQVKYATPVVTPQSTSPAGDARVDSQQHSAPVTDSSGATAPKKPQMNLGKALAGLALLGLTSPFLELSDPLHGIIGLIILFVGIRIAWKLTQAKQIDILGPFGEALPPAPLG